MRGLDRRADALGRGHDRLTLGRQFVHEGTHLVFVIGVGALERGHLAMDEAFQLTSAGNGPVRYRRRWMTLRGEPPGRA